jgi:hypothetical protein
MMPVNLVSNARSVTTGLMRDVMAAICIRLPVLNKKGRAADLDRFMELGAWTEAALALMEIEFPRWTLRRLIFEDGRWTCSLSREVGLPSWLDDTADGVHEVLPLAILAALTEVRRRSAEVQDAPPAVPSIQPIGAPGLSCENFS